MREFKFRAWHEHEECMVYPDGREYVLTHDLYNRFRIYSVDCVELFDFPQGELMQYTGLKDKNRKEIYEGDILRSSNKIGSVRWMEEHLQPMIYSKSLNQYFYLFDCLPSEIEIIGNIYENPELVGGKDEV